MSSRQGMRLVGALSNELPVTTGRRKLLIVDQRDETAIPVKMMLGCVQYEFDVARNRSDAIAKVLQNQPELICIDADTIGTPGASLAGWLQCSDETRDIPLLIVMAADSEASVSWREIRAARLIKPIPRDDLRRTVRQLLNITD